MQPSIGRIVHYQFTAEDARKINRRRVPNATKTDNWVPGSQAHIGSKVTEGDLSPAIITRVNYESVDAPTGTEHDIVSVNLQVVLDGNDSFWIEGVKELKDPENSDAGAGFWFWPPRV